MRLDDAVVWFLASWPYEGPRVPTQDTVRTYAAHLRWFAGFARSKGKLLASEALCPELLREAFKAQMAPRSARAAHGFKGGEAAANGLAYATRKLASWLLAQGVPVADLTGVRAPRAPERIQPRLRPEEFKWLEQAAMRQMVDSSHPRIRELIARDLALLYLLADTGLRCIEVHRMRIEDVNFDRGTVHIRGKGRKQRVLSIVDAGDRGGGRTLHLLHDWIGLRENLPHADEHDWLWTSVRGRQLTRTSIRRILQHLCESAGLDGSRPPHAFRRGNFTENYRADPRSLELLSARMGWSDKSQHMRAIYTRGAQLELAASEPLPSLATMWHSRVEQPPPMISRRATAGVPAPNEQPRRAADPRPRRSWAM